MSNASYLFTADALHSAARGRLAEPRPAGLWQRLRGAVSRFLKQLDDAAIEEALMQLDEHQLRDIGVGDELIARALVQRERREHPFAPTSLRGIEVASRRMNW